jgi:hypothetical protein
MDQSHTYIILNCPFYKLSGREIKASSPKSQKETYILLEGDSRRQPSQLGSASGFGRVGEASHTVVDLAYSLNALW